MATVILGARRASIPPRAPAAKPAPATPATPQRASAKATQRTQRAGHVGNIGPGDTIIEQHPDLVPKALRNTPRPRTHAYAADQPMDLGDVKLFGPKKAGPNLLARVGQWHDDHAAAAEQQRRVTKPTQPALEERRRSYIDDELEDEDPAVVRASLLEIYR